MADLNNAAPKKRWLERILEDATISGVVAWILDCAAKKFGPRTLDKLSDMLGEHVTKKYIEDKRAEILDDLRKMETSSPPRKTDKLWARHKKAIAELRESRFIILLCKIIADQKDPAMGRQATLAWLNDMGDEQFDQALFMLDQDNHIQEFQRWKNRLSRIRENIANDLKDFKQRMSARFGAAGLWIAASVENAWGLLIRFFQWLSSSRFRMFVFAAASVIVSILFFGFLRKRGVTKISGAQGSTTVAVSSFVGAAVVILSIAIAYRKLVPVWLDVDLWHYGVVLLLGAAFFFWGVPRLRYTLLIAAVLIAPIFFLGGRTAAKEKWNATWASATPKTNSPANVWTPPAQPVRPLAGATGIPDPRISPRPNPVGTPDKDVAGINPSATTVAPDVSDTKVDIPVSETPASKKPAGHCGTIDSPLSATVQYGDFYIVLQHCTVGGSQIRVSGTIHYQEHPGAEKRLLVFHRFRVLDGATGAVYTVQAGQFGTDKDFGMGYSWQWMDPGSTLGFSFVAGTVSDRPSTIHFNLPNNQTEEGFTFDSLSERAD